VKQPPLEKATPLEKYLQNEADAWVAERAGIEFTGKLKACAAPLAARARSDRITAP
jgi:hypothetical protein